MLGIVAISENQVFSAVLTAGSHAFKLEKKWLQKEVERMNAELRPRHGSTSDAKPEGLRQTFDEDVHAFQESLCDRDLSIEVLQLQLKARDDFLSGQYVSYRVNIVNCRKQCSALLWNSRCYKSSFYICWFGLATTEKCGERKRGSCLGRYAVE